VRHAESFSALRDFVKLVRESGATLQFSRHSAQLTRLTGRVRSRRGGSLVVRGEVGAGKTTLLDQALDHAPEFRVVRVAGVVAEKEVSLAAIHRLCEQVFDGLERLPAPQADALRTAFGLTERGLPDHLLLGLAVRNLLAEAAGPRPLICLVDDAQWLDGPSARTLAFVARRLDALPVGLVFALRERREELVGLPEVEVEGLSPVEARTLIDRVIPGPLDEEVRARIVSETEDNPVAIAELLSLVSPVTIAGGFGPPSAIPLPAGMEKAVRDELARLPDDVRRAVLVAAADPLGRPNLLWRATDVLGVPNAAVNRAEAAGLLRLGALVRFRHPAMRSAIYRAATPAERRNVHRALAEATDPTMDPDRRAWHRGEAMSGTDEEVATELERAVRQAQVKGGLPAAAALLARAAILTPDPARRSDRILAAAKAKLASGAIDEALELLARADSRLLQKRQGAQLEQLLAQAVVAQRGGGVGASMLMRAAKRLEQLDVHLAREAHLAAFEAAIHAGHLSIDTPVSQAAFAARAAPPTTQPPQAHDLLLDGLAALVSDGDAVAVPVLKQAIRNLEGGGGTRWLSLGAGIATDLWDDDAARALANQQRDFALGAGALMALQQSLVSLALLSIHAGDFAAAVELIEQSSLITTPSAFAGAANAPLMLSAFRGRESEALRLIEETIEHATAQGEGLTIAFAEEMTAVLQNSLGNYRDAFAAAQQAAQHAPLGVSAQALVELVEAAARSGEREAGLAALCQLGERARLSGTDWALGIEARSRALLSDAQVADKLYKSAIERLSRCSITIALARAHLVYGEWLRREGRRVEARQQLRIALRMFTAMGAQAFAERAERGLLATGERLRKRRGETSRQLTSQEAQISQLARDGHSNPEIAVKLYISPRTVEYHLTKIFSKLGISSRNQLHLVLAASEVSP
jgi:DNA-binding CsgD family transcriptional regulator